MRIPLVAALLLAQTTFAATPPLPYNTIELQAEAQREVPNDTLNASLYVELNNAQPAALADALNKASNEALRVAKEYKDIKVHSGSNQTYPVYGKGNVMQGWRGRAEIRIEARNFESATALIGKLQANLQLGNLNFSVSSEARRAAENELIVEAVAAFKSRAEIVRGALAGRSYKIERLAINSGGRSMPPPRMAVARFAESASEVTTPNVESGVTMITVTVGGAIEVLE